ncbi:MAG: NAD(P)H-binding protein [Terrimesophilobacter sp.]
MSTVLVTGATGTLGTPTALKLRQAGHDVRALSRKTGLGLTTGDLLTRRGIPEAMSGVDIVVHLATGSHDVAQAVAAIDSAREATVAHFILISIVGIENIPLGYYQGKVEIEGYLVESGLPHTIQRATQFHQFVDGIFRAQKFSPIILAPRFSFQPISTDDVASRLVELVGAKHSGRVGDIGGPEQRAARDLAETWKSASGSRRPIASIHRPGKTAAGFSAGHNLVSGAPYGVKTFNQFLDENYAIRPPAIPQ